MSVIVIHACEYEYKYVYTDICIYTWMLICKYIDTYEFIFRYIYIYLYMHIYIGGNYEISEFYKQTGGRD
jgi:hypothetical protein